MENENKDKEYTLQEIEQKINELKKLKQQFTVKSSYDTRPLKEKLLYDLQPLKLLTFSIKFLIISVLVASLIFGVGYWKGKSGKSVFVDMKDFQAKVICKYTKQQHEIGVKNYKFYMDGKEITEGDIPKLKPYGIELHPKLFAGLGTKGPAIGAGFELAHFYKLNLDAFLMSDKAIYAGISYDLKIDSTVSNIDWFSNSSIGLAIGKSLKDVDDTRVLLYWSIKL